MSHHVLIVDDDPLQRKMTEVIIANKFQYSTTLASGGREAIDIILSGSKVDIDLVLLDLSMPDINGIEVLRQVKPLKPDLPIIVLSAYGDVSSAVEAMRAGAVDFVEKQAGFERLQVSIENALSMTVLRHEVDRLQRSLSGQNISTDIIGQSKALNDTIVMVEKAADSSIPVLIEGESGVGKELFARTIHGFSDRSGKPFVAVNCGAIPENLLESIMFGHEKGSFTGALYRTVGKFREADGGTLFLDEVSELRLDLQVKLLRALQTGEIEPVGSRSSTKVNVRIISATNQNLETRVKLGKFREDLFYRLNVFPIHVPSLRERIEDIPLLIDAFLQRFSAVENKRIRGITERARELLLKYSWPGNVRQLENMIFRAVVLCDKDLLDINDFPYITKQLQPDLLRLSSFKDGTGLGSKIIGLTQEDGDFFTLANLEKETIKQALIHYDWHMSEVARRLGIGRSTLYRKMNEYDIRIPSDAEDEDVSQSLISSSNS